MAVLDNKKYLIIQMIEKATGNYHYPVTLYEAVMDSAGSSLEDILRKKFEELGLNMEEALQESLDKNLEDALKNLEEGELLEIRRAIEAVNNKLSVRESQTAYLATNWLKGILPLELTDIYQKSPRTVYYQDSEPETPKDGDYWEYSVDRTQIKEYVEGQWVNASENTAIMIYAMTSSYARDRGQFVITSGYQPPVSDGIDLDVIGDIYIEISEEVTPYIWLGTTWSKLSDKPTTSTDAPKTSIDPLIDLISCRYFTVAYRASNPGTDYWYDGNHIQSSYTITSGLEEFLISLFPVNVTDFYEIRRVVFLGPRKPTEASNGDAWIDTRSYRIYINTSETPDPVWVYQAGDDKKSTYLSCTNLLRKSEAFDAFTDRGLWMDIRTGTYSTMMSVNTIDGHGVQEVTGANLSIAQRVKVRPNTMYTYSVDVRVKDSTRLPNMYFLADGCEIVSQSFVNGYTLEYSEEYVRHHVTFITGPLVTESTCRLETPSGYPFQMHSPCLQEGTSTQWTSSIRDLLGDFNSVLEGLVQRVVVSREQEPSTTRDGYLWIDDNGTTVKSYNRDKWVSIQVTDIEGLSAAIESVYSVYTAPGETVFTTSHNSPTNPSIGDYWIKDDLSAVRYTGTGWGSISGVLASEQKILSGRVDKSTETLVQSVFLETTINVDDLFDLASSIDPTITLYKQGTLPISPTTGDIWLNTSTGGVMRFNGVSWVPYGGAKLSSIEQDIDGVRSDVAEVYDGGSGRNLIPNSRSVEIPSTPYVVYSELEHNSNYVFSVQSSSASIITQYTVRVTNALHTLDYDNTVFTVGNTVNLWRFDTNSIPAGATPHLIVTFTTGETSLVLSKIQLEKGKIYTDWKPSPDDVTSQVSDLSSDVSRLDGTVSEQSAKVDAVSQDLQDAIRISNEALSRAVTVEQTASSYSITSSALVRRVTDLENTLDTYSSVFEFKPEGLEISSRVNGIRSDISTYYRSNGMYFWSASAGTDVGYVTAEGINIRNARVQVGGILAMGNFKWKPRSTGATSLIYEVG